MIEIENEHARAWAGDALAWLLGRNAAPTPANFEVGYAYVSGENPDLRQNVDRLASIGRKIDDEILSTLHRLYFRPGLKDEAVSELSERISAELDSAVKLMQTSSSHHSTYGRTLAQASGALGERPPATAVKTLIDQVVSATHAMEARSKLLEQQLQASSSEVTQLRDRLEVVRRESFTDELTRVYNRRAFDSHLDECIKAAIGSGEPLSLLMCDIDRFKAFNDTWGHQTGDQVLRLVADCLTANVKGRDIAARFGGEEFAVILPLTSLGDAATLANQIRVHIGSVKAVRKSTGDQLGSITISIGAAQYHPNEGAADLIGRADACLYAAKEGGRNRVVSETEGIGHDAPAKQTRASAA